MMVVVMVAVTVLRPVASLPLPNLGLVLPRCQGCLTALTLLMCISCSACWDRLGQMQGQGQLQAPTAVLPPLRHSRHRRPRHRRHRCCCCVSYVATSGRVSPGSPILDDVVWGALSQVRQRVTFLPTQPTNNPNYFNTQLNDPIINHILPYPTILLLVFPLFCFL